MKALEVLPAINLRRSIRSYQEKMLSEEQIQVLLEAARWAPSSMNEQPWRYVVGVKGDARYDLILAGILESNRIWATKAPVLILSLAKKNFARNNTPNRHALYDTGAANALLSVQAAADGLQVHQMGGILIEDLRKSFNLGDEVEVAAVLSVGYPDDPNLLPSPLKERETAPRVRKSIEELLVTS